MKIFFKDLQLFSSVVPRDLHSGVCVHGHVARGGGEGQVPDERPAVGAAEEEDRAEQEEQEGAAHPPGRGAPEDVRHHLHPHSLQQEGVHQVCAHQRSGNDTFKNNR